MTLSSASLIREQINKIRLFHQISTVAGKIIDTDHQRHCALGTERTLQGKSHLCIPFLGIARPQSQFFTFMCL